MIMGEKEIWGDRRLYVVGPRRLQNELIVSFLERETGIGCEGIADLHDIPAGNKGPSRLTRLILWDCLGKGPGDLQSDFEAYGEKRIFDDLFLVFNASHGVGIEETAI